MAAQYAIEARGLRKNYGSLVAVDGVDLVVEDGEIFGFLGPNGAGKTTTIEILEGYSTPDAGSARVLGLDPARQGDELRQSIGIVLQETALFPELTVEEALDLFAGYYRAPVNARELVAVVGLEEKRRSRVKTLSGGQRRRLDLALALVGDPRLLFLDEPTVGFDPQSRREAWQLVRGQRERARTVFLTTQAMDEAEALCDRVAIIERGRIVALDTPAGLRRRLGEGVRIAFRCNRPLDLARLRAIEGVRLAEGHDGAYQLVVDDPTAPLHEVTGQALAAGATLRDLSVSGASLEDVYLRLTGEEARA